MEVCRTGYIPHPEISFATVDAEIKKVRCNIKGDYWILELPLDQTYNVTASAYRYFPQTKIVTLTENSPSRCVHFCLKKDYDSKARAINQDVSCGGTIYGHTLESHDTWGAYPVPLALVDAGIKQTISDPIMGYYRITGLPFDQEITITASKKGYDSDTLKHTFTELRPTYYYCFDLQEDEDVTVKHIWNEEGTFTIMALAMNTDNSISPWGTLSVTMPRNRATLFLQFLEQYPILYQLLQSFLRL